MLNSGQSTFSERRSRSQNMIRELIHTRTEMLALYSKLAASKPYDGDDDTIELLQEFFGYILSGDLSL